MACAESPRIERDTRHIRPVPVGTPSVMKDTLAATRGPLYSNVTGITSNTEWLKAIPTRLIAGGLAVCGLRAERKWCD